MMIYLEVFKFPNDDMEFDFLIEEKRMCYDSFYPPLKYYQVVGLKELILSQLLFYMVEMVQENQRH